MFLLAVYTQLSLVPTIIVTEVYKYIYIYIYVYIYIMNFDHTLFLIVNADDDELNSCVGFLCVTASRLILAVNTCIM